MSDVSSSVLFEHPLNEKMRTWLRIEFLLQQLYGQQALSETGYRSNLLPHPIRSAGRTGTRRSAYRTAKELERQQQKLLTWVDMPLIDQLRNQLKARAAALMAAPRLDQALRKDSLISLVRQRLSIPGGCCSFDLLPLHMWMHAPQQDRDVDIVNWLQTLAPLNEALTMALDLIRQTGSFRNQISLNGFFQSNAEGADMLRLSLNLTQQLYPQISGHKTRYAIRFLPLDNEHGVVPKRLAFELACC